MTADDEADGSAEAPATTADDGPADVRDGRGAATAEGDRGTGGGGRHERGWRSLLLAGDPRRWATFTLGVVALGLGVTLVILAELGVSSWQLLEVGLVATTGWSFTLVVLTEAVFALALGWAWLDERPGPGTWAIALALGPLIDVGLSVLATPATLLGRSVFLVVGTVSLGLGLGLYLAADVGPSAQDTVFAGLVRSKGVRPAVAKAVIDIVLGVAGVLLGARLGVGTIVLTFALPLVVERGLVLGHRLAGTPPMHAG